ncbi:hypothetical protein BpHYR1_037560, partial [Brachionus plicatilis]
PQSSLTGFNEIIHTLQHKVLNDLLNIKNTLPINHSQFDLGLFELFANSHLFCQDINKISLKASLNEFQSLSYYLATMLILFIFTVHYIIRSILAIFEQTFIYKIELNLNKIQAFYCLILCKYKVQRFVSEDLKLSQVIRAQELKLGDFMNDLLNARLSFFSQITWTESGSLQTEEGEFSIKKQHTLN